MSRGEREPSVPCPLLSPPPDGGTPPAVDTAFSCPSAAIIPSDKTKAPTQSRCFFFGAADEARTRYLHLGKVALYQMSYSRIPICDF